MKQKVKFDFFQWKIARSRSSQQHVYIYYHIPYQTNERNRCLIVNVTQHQVSCETKPDKRRQVAADNLYLIGIFQGNLVLQRLIMGYLLPLLLGWLHLL